MGTTYSVAIKSHDVDSDFLKKEFESILAKINHEMSTYKEESLISKFNSDSSKKNFQLSFDFSYVIEKSFFYNDLSNGLFDITIHPLYDLWGFQSKSLDSIEPTSNQVLNILEFVGMDNLNFDASKMILSKVNPKTSIDLSAIAKGYAVDLIANYLEDLGYESFLVDIGGELRVASFDKTFWEIGIQKPDINEIGSVSEVINLRNKSIATSGNYSNFINYINTGSLRSHIVNPKTGYPVLIRDGLVASASVISSSCIDADAIATILMLLSVEDAINFVEKIDDTEAYLIYIENGLFKTIETQGFDNFRY